MQIRTPHRCAKQWQKPDEFLPDRFNSDSPLFLTPEGKLRCTTAYIPFSLGPRSCLGKALALAELRALFVYFIGKGTFSVINKEVLEDEEAHFSIMSRYKLHCRVDSFKGTN